MGAHLAQGRVTRDVTEGSAPVSAQPLAPFLLRVAAWLVPAFLIWWIASPVLVWPVAFLTQLVTRLGFGDLVQSVEHSGGMITFVTSARPLSAAVVGGAKAVLEVTSNVRLFSFGLPLLAAMILAAREPHPLRNLVIGYGVMIPFQTFSVIADFLKNLIGVPGIAAQLGISPWQRETIAFSYQFGTLILPTVAPAVFWVLTHRRFLEDFARPASSNAP